MAIIIAVVLCIHIIDRIYDSINENSRFFRRISGTQLYVALPQLAHRVICHSDYWDITVTLTIQITMLTSLQDPSENSPCSLDELDVCSAVFCGPRSSSNQTDLRS